VWKKSIIVVLVADVVESFIFYLSLIDAVRGSDYVMLKWSDNY
jgi:hypothetical protein